MTSLQLKRISTVKLAEYASDLLRLPERDCYQAGFVPLPKAVLIANILAAIEQGQ
jgi:hypothetical protein